MHRLPCATKWAGHCDGGGRMTRRGQDRKAEELAKSRTLNPHPEAVADALFVSSEFFDAADLVQVKYEMVRRVEVDGTAVNAAAGSFGFSRQSYYTAAAALSAGGLPGLVPAKPGPRRAHKLSEPVLDHLQSLRAAGSAARSDCRWSRTGSGSACTHARSN